MHLNWQFETLRCSETPGFKTLSPGALHHHRHNAETPQSMGSTRHRDLKTSPFDTNPLNPGPGGETLDAMRRYEVASVRRRAVGRALPRAYLQADLDIVSPPATSLTEAALAEAEVIKVTLSMNRIPLYIPWCCCNDDGTVMMPPPLPLDVS